MGFKEVSTIRDLKIGDIVRHKVSDIAFVVTGVYGARATAVRTIDLTNAREWTVLRPEPKVIEDEPKDDSPF